MPPLRNTRLGKHTSLWPSQVSTPKNAMLPSDSSPPGITVHRLSVLYGAITASTRRTENSPRSRAPSRQENGAPTVAKNLTRSDVKHWPGLCRPLNAILRFHRRQLIGEGISLFATSMCPTDSAYQHLQIPLSSMTTPPVRTSHSAEFGPITGVSEKRVKVSPSELMASPVKEVAATVLGEPTPSRVV